jgi:hypothetical protein
MSSKGCRYIMNTQKSLVFVHTCNKHFKSENKEAISFRIEWKRIKYLEIRYQNCY